MHTKLETCNPHGCSRYGFAWQHVPAGGVAHLDFGCGDGRFLAGLKGKRIDRLVGVDVSRQAVRGAEKTADGLEIIHLVQTTPLPFPDGAFSSITLLDVLEHLDDQEALLDELNRVLRDDGILIVTVPGRHALSFLDMGNLKFRFPTLHRWYYSRKHSPQAYQRRYVSNPDGLVGDISARKRWHEHFTREQLAMLLDRGGFPVAAFDGAGLFARVLKIAHLTVGRMGSLRARIERLMAWDARRFESANVFCVAWKCSSGCRWPSK